jgi:ribose transport system substrate-binding protein
MRQQASRKLQRAVGLALPAALCAIAAAGCGSSGSSGSSAKSTAGKDSSSVSATSTAASGAAPGSATVDYTGAVAKLPEAYPVPKKTTSGVKIGYLQITDAQDSLQLEQQGATKRAGQLGVHLIVKDCELSPATQVAQFEQLLDQGVKAIIVYPVVPAALGPELAAAQKAGVKVIGDSASPDASQALPKGFATSLEEPVDRAAYEMARSSAAAQPHAQVGVIGTALPIAILKYVVARQRYWANRFGLKVVAEADIQQDTPSGYGTAVNQLLSNNPKLQQIWTYSELQGLTAGTVVHSSGRQVGVYVNGLTGDAPQVSAFQSGRLTMGYEGHWTDQGMQMMNAAYDEATGQHLPLPKAVIIPGTVVTKGNAAANAIK